MYEKRQFIELNKQMDLTNFQWWILGFGGKKCAKTIPKECVGKYKLHSYDLILTTPRVLEEKKNSDS